MTWDIEKDVLFRAIRNGLVRLDSLIEKRVLDAATVDRLMEEADAEQGASDEKVVEIQPTSVVLPNDEGGRKSFGHYQALEPLGQGGMTRVYRAYDPVLQRNVALKLLRLDDARLKERFLREARAQARACRPSRRPRNDRHEVPGERASNAI